MTAHGRILDVDFARELDSIGSFLAQHHFRFAIIGGVALSAYGNPRLTLDLDLVTDWSVHDRVIEFMESQGYATLHTSPGYSNHRHADRARGRIDFMYVRDATAERIFESLRHLPGPGGRTIPVPRPEYLIAMKVQAMRDAPDRMLQDLVDCAYLLQVDGVDREEARGYFVRAGLEARWNEIDGSLV